MAAVTSSTMFAWAEIWNAFELAIQTSKDLKKSHEDTAARSALEFVKTGQESDKQAALIHSARAEAVGMVMDGIRSQLRAELIRSFQLGEGKD